MATEWAWVLRFSLPKQFVRQAQVESALSVQVLIVMATEWAWASRQTC
ncbi:hypothetical protein FACS1894200_02800 [Spirochaetia bacterium]|nr:hypothetical protein FACS1894200_02800 [Spirochaetia bacterium]